MSRRRRILFSAPSNDEDDEMAEKEGETKYANINKEEGEEGRKDMRRREGGEEKRRTRDGAAAEMLSGHFCT